MMRNNPRKPEQSGLVHKIQKIKETVEKRNVILMMLNFIDKTRFIRYNMSGDKRRLIVWKPYVSVKAVSPTESGTDKSSESYCEWNR